MQTLNEVVGFFYNLAEFAFEYFRDSRRILAPLAKLLFFSQIVFLQHDRTAEYVGLARACAPVALSQMFFF